MATRGGTGLPCKDQRPQWISGLETRRLHSTPAGKRFVRNRGTATGGRRFPFPVPKSVRLLAERMIVSDDPDHKRLRGLVQRAFTPGALKKLEMRINSLAHELLDVELAKEGPVDLIKVYALPIPVTVIREMVGVHESEMAGLHRGMRMLSEGFSGWSLFRTLFFDFRTSVRFVRQIVRRKRDEPGDDILSSLIAAEEDGESLSEDELISMVFLIIVAGYETTVHLIANAVATLLQHPEQTDLLRGDPALAGSMVEEVLRFLGPIQGTKPLYPLEDVELHGVHIPKGSVVMPVLASANHDPSVFPDPGTFDIQRSPNRHMGFGYGPHVCLGAALARMETKIAINNLLERSPDLRLAIPAERLEIQDVQFWHRLKELPVHLR